MVRIQAARPMFAALLLLLIAGAIHAQQAEYRSVLLMDALSGEVLFAENEHEALPPASMVKMMTELIVLEHIANGELNSDDPVTVSAKASRMGGSQVYLKEGEVFTVRELLMALAIQSANDAAVALAEHLAGSVVAFVELMNGRAAELGMNDTVFHFVHGLPPAGGQDSDLSSAYDMALLGREIAKHPQALEWAVMDQVPFRDGMFLLTNPNPLVGTFRGLEGIKTGYTSRAGFCLTAAASQKGVRLISVVMGAPSNAGRGRETTRLLTRGFNMFTRLTLVAEEHEPLPEPWPVAGGKQKEIALVFAEPLVVGVQKERSADVVFTYQIPAKLTAPLMAGEVVGRAAATLDGRTLGEVDVLAAATVAKGSFLQRLLHR